MLSCFYAEYAQAFKTCVTNLSYELDGQPAPPLHMPCWAIEPSHNTLRAFMECVGTAKRRREDPALALSNGRLISDCIQPKRRRGMRCSGRKATPALT